MVGPGRKRDREPSFPVNPVFGALPKSHPAARALEDVPRPPAQDWVAGSPVFGALLLSFAAVGLLLGDSGSITAIGFLGFFAGLVAWGGMIGGSLALGAILMRRRRREFDLRRLGAPREGETYVGIAYAEGFWTLREDVAWDRGYLSVSPDGIRFRGYAAEIALPAHAIRAVRLETSRTSPHDRIPRIFVDWISPDGEENTLSLDTRASHFSSKTLAEIVALRDSISAAMQSSASRPLTPQWPPAVRLERLDLRSSQMVVTARDLMVFALGVIPGVALSVGIRALLQFLPVDDALRPTLLTWFGFIAPVLPAATGFGIFARYQIGKYKALPQPNQPVTDPVPTAMAELPTEQIRPRP